MQRKIELLSSGLNYMQMYIYVKFVQAIAQTSHGIGRSARLAMYTRHDMVYATTHFHKLLINVSAHM